jgi:hypothetical protein
MHRIEWDPHCFRQLDEIEAAGVTRERLANAVRAIHLELTQSAGTTGEHLSEGLYKIELLSLRFYFHIDEAQGVVSIDGLRWMGH